uniref:Uncharacterized protein n=1 Tax=Anser cygnoides TaxID=8845 RepID=A0A8B9EFG0_ANSCY
MDFSTLSTSSSVAPGFADQQRRERLKKKIARCEKEMSVGKNASRSSSRESGRLLSTSFGQVDILILLSRYHSLLASLSPYGEHGLVHSSPVKHTRKHSRNTSNTSNSNSCVSTSSTPRKHSGVSSSCSSGSFVSIGRSQRHQDRNSKVYSGDLLDRHSELFTGSRKPFTPRTLISDAKSVLSEYRYYTPARRKRKNRCKRHVEAETQTDVIREDDLLYLTFIEDFIMLCKMRHLLDVLKADLSCSTEEIQTDWEAVDSLDLEEFNMMEEPELTSKRQRQRKATKSEEFLTTMDLLLKEPSTCELPVCSENSKETRSKDDFLEDVAEMKNAEAESHSYVKSEDPDTSPSCEATLNLITCDSELEANKELDDLEENFAEVLQISHDYS